MTNKEDETSPPYDPRIAALLAVHLVSQVMDEAYVIANAAKESGRPWRYVTSLKKLRSCRVNELYDEDMTFTVSNGDSQYLNDNNIENLSNAVVTSTPQKTEVAASKSKNESIFIGQGDEGFEEVSSNKLRKSTSMFINYLFDMSGVENVNSSDEADVVLNTTIGSDQNELLTQAMEKIMESYVNAALDIVFCQECPQEDSGSKETSDVTDQSSYSFLSDVCDVENGSYDVIDGVLTKSAHGRGEKANNDVTAYENAYLTLNRDYDQYSEEDEPVLQDPKAIPLQEVELLTATTSIENVTPYQAKKEVAASGVSTSTGVASRKSNLVRRCRIQGARLLSCLKGWWWRRKLPGKRKDPRAPGSIRDLCPITPDARRRAASLLDQRRTPSPSKFMVWKFNTVNEALVHSSRWKEFGLKMSLNENDEF